VPILRPMVGPDKLMRDPCLLHGPDGQWHMVWTTGWWDKAIGIAHSKDLVHWSEQRFLPVMADFPDAINSWAPEITYDSKLKQYVIFWSSTIPGKFTETERIDGDHGPNHEALNHRYYFTTTTNFTAYSPTKLLWDPGFNCIDATLLHRKNSWLLFGKDETKAPKPAKFIFQAEAKSATGPFTVTQPRITGDFWAEGPTAIDLGDRVRVYFDRYVDDHWGAVESSDLTHWTDISSQIHMIPHARHGTIQLVDRKVVDGLVKALGK